jgi:thiopurine S-methyltransferase
VEPDFWHARWQQRQIGFHRAEPHPSLVRWWPALGLPANSRVFVPLCGKSRDLGYLAARGHDVIGCELSPVAAEAFFAEAAVAPERATAGRFERWRAQGITILVGDFFDLQAADLGMVTAVYDRAALVALPPAMRRDYAAHIAALLPVGANGLLLTLDYPQEAMDGPPFSVDATEIEALFGPHFALELLQRHPAADVPPRCRESGSGTMHESAYRLTRHQM